jgi:hypothetical protein
MILPEFLEEVDVDVDDLDFIPPRRPPPLNNAPIDVECLLNDKRYRQALPTPQASYRYFYNRLHKMPPYNFSLCFGNMSCSDIPSAMVLEKAGWFRVGSRGGRMVFCTYNFVVMPREAKITTATSPVLILTPWGMDGKLIHLSGQCPAFKLVEDWGTLEFTSDFGDHPRISNWILRTHARIVSHLNCLWNGGDVQIVPLEMTISS